LIRDGKISDKAGKVIDLNLGSYKVDTNWFTNDDYDLLIVLDYWKHFEKINLLFVYLSQSNNFHTKKIHSHIHTKKSWGSVYTQNSCPKNPNLWPIHDP
jgi:hypothetical protein